MAVSLKKEPQNSGIREYIPEHIISEEETMQHFTSIEEHSSAIEVSKEKQITAIASSNIATAIVIVLVVTLNATGVINLLSNNEPSLLTSSIVETLQCAAAIAAVIVSIVMLVKGFINLYRAYELNKLHKK